MKPTLVIVLLALPCFAAGVRAQESEAEPAAAAQAREVAPADNSAPTSAEPLVMEGPEEMDMSSGEMAGHHAMAHPFLAHMGLPDGPGEANIRVVGIWRTGHEESGADLGLHVEAGLVPRVGIHVRNDAFFNTGAGDSHNAPDPAAPTEEGHSEGGHGTEVMVMVTAIENEASTAGLAVFGQVAFPTPVDDDSEPVTTALGVSGRYMLADRFLLDGNVHFSLTGDEFHTEYELSAMVRVVDQVFVMLEGRGDLSEHEQSVALLPAVKYRLGPVAIGAGVQIPLTEAAYDWEALLQFDVGFM